MPHYRPSFYHYSKTNLPWIKGIFRWVAPLLQGCIRKLWISSCVKFFMVLFWFTALIMSFLWIEKNEHRPEPILNSIQHAAIFTVYSSFSLTMSKIWLFFRFTTPIWFSSHHYGTPILFIMPDYCNLSNDSWIWISSSLISFKRLTTSKRLSTFERFLRICSCAASSLSPFSFTRK